MAEILFGIAQDFPNLEFIDFGSGFKVAYKEGDITTNVYDLGVKLGNAFDSFCSTYGRQLEMWFEPGKYLVSEAGVLLVKVIVYVGAVGGGSPTATSAWAPPVATTVGATSVAAATAAIRIRLMCSSSQPRTVFRVEPSQPASPRRVCRRSRSFRRCSGR